jgi:geranylgeranyl diphosphate synthase, type II
MRSLTFNFDTYLKTRCKLVEDRLAAYLSDTDPPQLFEAMRYSVLSGGKRIRAVLCLASAEAVAAAEAVVAAEPVAPASPSAAQQIALPCACAIEMIHAMSLIHDDLPCMDDDDFRRGKPSNHKVFGEAIALLSGDALLVYALEVLLRQTSASSDRSTLISVASELCAAAGARGMTGGQVGDMEVTGKAHLPPQEGAALLDGIHRRKTGALIRFSVWSGACLIGASPEILSALARFGEVLGLSFQIADDLLDVTGDIKTLGKTPGKDLLAGKLTWVTVYGVEEAKLQLANLEAKGKSLLAQTGLPEEKLAPLAALLEYAIHRSH